MLDCEAAAAPFGDAGIHVDNVAKRGWHEEIATGLDKRNAGDFVLAKHFGLFYSQGAVKEGVCAGIEIFKIAGKENNSERIAIAPFNLNFSSVNEHS